MNGYTELTKGLQKLIASLEHEPKPEAKSPKPEAQSPKPESPSNR